MRSENPPIDDDDFDETSPELMTQIKEGREAYLRGDVQDFDEFMASLEAELNDESAL